LDPDGVTFAVATTAEERIARKLGPTARIGLAASNGIPEGKLVSFGIAGSLRSDLAIGTVIDATRVVDESGETLWQGRPLGVRGAQTGTILGASRIVDDPSERARLHESTGADAVDMESGALARSGRLAGVIRAISDTPERRLGGIAQGAKANGETDVLGFLRGFAREPRTTLRAARGAVRALRALEEVA
jgi:nucleoside phosphorylase